MQPINPSIPLQPVVTAAQPECCIHALLKRIAQAIASVFKSIQSLFCGESSHPQTPSPLRPSIPPTPQPSLQPSRVTPPTPQTLPARMVPVVPQNPVARVADPVGPEFIAVRPARVAPVAPIDRTEQCLGFYRGVVGDMFQRMLAQIWAWDDVQLEGCHDYIQCLFPSYQFSANNPQAPLLNPAIIQAFHNDQGLRDNLLTSFNRMLRFYGLQLDEGAVQITRAPNAAARQAVWLTNPIGHHNYLRMTRIIISLRALGLPQHAQAFYQILNDIAQHEGQQYIPQYTINIWHNAARA